MRWVDVPLKDTTPETMHQVGMGLMVFGAMCMTLRGGTTIDRQAGTVSRWIGLLIPMIRRTRAFEASAVHLTHETTRQKGVTYHEYPIALVTPEGELQLGATDKVMPAWNAAQSIAQFLGLELIDESQEVLDGGLIPSLVRAMHKKSA